MSGSKLLWQEQLQNSLIEAKKIEAQLDMLNSLKTSIDEAGGSSYDFLDPDLTLRELVEGLANNGIRFYFKQEINHE